MAAFSGHAVVNGVWGGGRSIRPRRAAVPARRGEPDPHQSKRFVSLAPMPSRAVSSVRRMPCRGDAQGRTGITTGRRSASGWWRASLPRVGDLRCVRKITAVARHVSRETDARRGRQGRKCSSSETGRQALRDRFEVAESTIRNGRNGRRGDHDRPAQRAAAGGRVGRRDIRATRFSPRTWPEPTISPAGSDGPCSTTMPTIRRTAVSSVTAFIPIFSTG